MKSLFHVAVDLHVKQLYVVVVERFGCVVLNVIVSIVAIHSTNWYALSFHSILIFHYYSIINGV